MFSFKFVQPVVSIYPSADYALQMFGWWCAAMAALVLVCGILPSFFVVFQNGKRVAAAKVFGLCVGALMCLGIMLLLHIFFVSVAHLVIGESYWHISLDELSLGDGFYQWYLWFGLAIAIGLVEIGASIWLLFAALKKLNNGNLFEPLREGKFQDGVQRVFDCVLRRGKKPKKAESVDDAKKNTEPKQKQKLDIGWFLRQLWLPIIVWLLLAFVGNLPLFDFAVIFAVTVSAIGALLFGAKNTVEVFLPSLVVVGLLSMIEMHPRYLLLIGFVTLVLGLFLKSQGDRLKSTKKWLLILLYFVAVAGIISLALFGFEGSVVLTLWAAAVVVSSAVALLKLLWAWLPGGSSAS